MACACCGDCCGLAGTETLFATITNCPDGECTIQLDPQGNMEWAALVICGEFEWNLHLSCASNTFTLQAGQGHILCNLSDTKDASTVTCSPLELVFNMTYDGCPCTAPTITVTE